MSTEESTCTWKDCKEPWPSVPTVGWTQVVMRYILHQDPEHPSGMVETTIFFCPEHSKAFFATTKLDMPEVTIF